MGTIDYLKIKVKDENTDNTVIVQTSSRHFTIDSLPFNFEINET